ncbi:glycosyltransferase [Nocardioides sp. cx-173]|uniref:glycosyltransferase n=1 Tax=Nocardioides sp. cx-173 TaxID=2898796 RepID=UPI001E2B7AE1|nr:glycosyltransferase [Nocardioides sp. cx-173]MCD4527370.1 glycosyltransferase [Nocardioides sp. cx-173]UGB42413.1 glycosyltransferase [Nocardioides sp. cx-173]
MRILLWHVHGSWTTSFVQGPHEYVVPVTADRGPDGLGRARTWDWPASVREVAAEDLRDLDVDLVVLQRPHELDLAERWLGRRPGRDLPAVYVEHNTPAGDVPDTRHPLADQDQILLAHVTGFNQLFWDCGSARTVVVDHGIVDPGHRYTGEIARAAVAINDPVRRGRSVGTDLVPLLARTSGVDVFGMRVDLLPAATGLPPHQLSVYEDLPQDRMHDELARRRVYVHTARWTSLGLSLLEAMHLGMPVVALATTEAVLAVPPHTGVVATRPDQVAAAAAAFVADPALAASTGAAARRHALDHYGLKRFLDDWDVLLEGEVGR